MCRVAEIMAQPPGFFHVTEQVLVLAGVNFQELHFLFLLIFFNQVFGNEVEHLLEQKEEQKEREVKEEVDGKDAPYGGIFVIHRNHHVVAEGNQGGHDPCDAPHGFAVEMFQGPSEFLIEKRQVNKTYEDYGKNPLGDHGNVMDRDFQSMVFNIGVYHKIGKSAKG